MRKIIKISAVSLILVFLGLVFYGAHGYFDAVSDSEELEARADSLLAADLGVSSLGEERYRQLLMLQDPAFEQHIGVDMTSPGGGVTTITQSLAKRVGFKNFTPGIGKIRQTGYALGLEHELDKEQILVLWLATLEMGRGPDGWVTGFHNMSETMYGAPPGAIAADEYLSLLAVLIAPGRYNLGTDDQALQERTDRIRRLLAGECLPNGNSDVWLEGCNS